MRFSTVEKGIAVLWIVVVGSFLGIAEYDLPTVLGFALLPPLIYFPLKYLSPGSKKKRKRRKRSKKRRLL
jgi:hypothetical protein